MKRRTVFVAVAALTALGLVGFVLRKPAPAASRARSASATGRT